MTSNKPFLIRKLLHVFLGILFLYFLHVLLQEFGKATTLVVMTSLLALLLIIDLFRVEFSITIKHLIKQREQHTFHAATLAVAAAIILFAVFDSVIAFAVMSISIFGDCAASLIGRFYGKHRIRGKSWEGFAANLVTAFLVGLLFLPVWKVAILALVAAALELFCTHTEDNFLVPIIVAIIASL